MFSSLPRTATSRSPAATSCRSASPPGCGSCSQRSASITYASSANPPSVVWPWT
ncbi:hypothetical protein ACFQY4_26865 [Catellatospora bangladeshensis]|uniref:hypothetical protein n=1 Tax=Catellatospora bangladeshensis TaxID=310355 RepID=UPI00361273CC